MRKTYKLYAAQNNSLQLFAAWSDWLQIILGNYSRIQPKGLDIVGADRYGMQCENTGFEMLGLP